jgi:hypothetical protein
MTLSESKRREFELFFLKSVREGIALDVAAAEKGGLPRKWEGKRPPTSEELEQLRQYLRNVEAAIKHIEDGGALDDTPHILWGHKPTS